MAVGACALGGGFLHLLACHTGHVAGMVMHSVERRSGAAVLAEPPEREAD
jgi:hypothetical protein